MARFFTEYCLKAYVDLINALKSATLLYVSLRYAGINAGFYRKTHEAFHVER